MTSSSVPPSGISGSLGPVFGGAQTRKHPMFANEQTSRHPMFANKQTSEHLKQSGNRIVAKIPASLWRVAGQLYFLNFLRANFFCAKPRWWVSYVWDGGETPQYENFCFDNFCPQSMIYHQVVWLLPRIFSSFALQHLPSFLQSGRSKHIIIIVVSPPLPSVNMIFIMNALTSMICTGATFCY